MFFRERALLTLLLLFASLAIADDKKKDSLPAYVLQARTILVVINPEAGVSLTGPLANRTAQEDVEKALMKWGRFTLVMTTTEADLVIAVRKGSGKTVSPTIGGVPVNDRPVIVQPTGGDTRVGVQQGHPPPLGTSGGQDGQDNKPHPKAEVGPADDMLEIYRGGVELPLDSPPVWRYIAKNALHSPDVPAVGEWRRLIEKAEKQQKP